MTSIVVLGRRCQNPVQCLGTKMEKRISKD